MGDKPHVIEVIRAPSILNEDFIEDVAERVKEDLSEDVTKDVIEQISGAIKDEGSSDTRDSNIRKYPIYRGFLMRLFYPLFRFIWRTIVGIILIGVSLGVGAYRMFSIASAYKWFIFFFIGMFISTAAFSANYTIISDTIRPAFQIVDDIILRGFVTIFNDLYGLLGSPLCTLFNLYFEFVFCTFRIYTNVVRLLIKCLSSIGFDLSDPSDTSACDSGPIDDAFIDDFLLGVEWIDIINPLARKKDIFTSSKTLPFTSYMTSDGMNLRGMPVHVEYKSINKDVTGYSDTYNGGNLEHSTFFSTIHSRMNMKQKDDYVHYGISYDSDEHVEALNNFTRWSKDSGGIWKRYDPQFLNVANIGFDFGWDPDDPLPQVNGPGIGYDIYETFYDVIALLTDFLFTMVIFFFTCFKLLIADSIYLFIVAFFECVDAVGTAVFDLVHSEILTALASEDEDQPFPISDILDIFELFWNECLVDFAETWFEELFVQFYSKIFEFVVNILLEIPCLRFDSIGCFTGSIFECIDPGIGLFDLEECLGCDTMPFPSEAITGGATDSDECMEIMCRVNGDGFVEVLSCIFDIIIELVAQGLCPVLEAIYCYCELIDEFFQALGSILTGAEQLCNRAASIVEFEIDFDFEDPLDLGFSRSWDVNFDSTDTPVSLDGGDNDDDNDDGPSDDLFCYVFDSPIGFTSFDISSVINDEGDQICPLILSPIDLVCIGSNSIGNQTDCETDNAFFSPLFSAFDALSKRGMTEEKIKQNKMKGMSNEEILNLFKDGKFTFDGVNKNEDFESKDILELYEHLNNNNYNNNTQINYSEGSNYYIDDVETLSKRRAIFEFNHMYRSFGKVKKNLVNKKSVYSEIDIPSEVRRRIRKDKAMHTFLSLVKTKNSRPYQRDKNEEYYKRDHKRRLNKRIKRMEEHGRGNVTSEYEEFRSNVNSVYRSIRKKDEMDHVWDDFSDYAQHYRYARSNFSVAAMHFVSLLSKVRFGESISVQKDSLSGGRSTYSGDDRGGGYSPSSGLRFPDRNEMDDHFIQHKTHVYIAKGLTSIMSFMHTMNEETSINVDKFIRDNDPSYHPSDAPSLKHAHLYTTPEERRELRKIIKQQKFENGDYKKIDGIRSFAARAQAYIHIGAAALFAPHRIDYAVNRLAMRGPHFDDAITQALRSFGRNRKFETTISTVFVDPSNHNNVESKNGIRMEKSVSYWKTYEDIKYMEEIKKINGGEKLYTISDYKRDYKQVEKIISGELDINDESTNNNKIVNRNGINEEKAAMYKKQFPFLKHPEPRAITRIERLNQTVQIHERFAVIEIGSVLLSNPKWLMGAIPLALTNPVAESTFKLWGNFLLRWFSSIFFDYISFSVASFEDLSRDLAETILFNIVYALNYIMQQALSLSLIVLLQVLDIIAGIILRILSVIYPGVGLIFKIIISIIDFAVIFFSGVILFLLPIPPDPVMDFRGAPTQNPIGYLYDLFFCNVTEGVCSVASDCISGAECICPGDTLLEWKTTFWKVNNPTPCPGLTGHCQCYPQFTCDLRFPVIPLSNIITPDCDQFRWDLEGAVWYSSKGNYVDRWWSMTKASYTNFIVSSKFILRSLFAGWNTFLSQVIFVALLVVSFIIIAIILRKMTYAFMLLFFMLVILYFADTLTNFVADEVIPFLRDVETNNFFLLEWFYINDLFGYIAEFITFPNASIANPIGTPDIVNGEFTCFVIGFISSTPGFLFLMFLLFSLIFSFSTGLLRLLAIWVVFLIYTIILMGWSFLWVYFQTRRMELLYKDISDYVINAEVSKRFISMAARIENETKGSNIIQFSQKKLKKFFPKSKTSNERQQHKLLEIMHEESNEQHNTIHNLHSMLKRMENRVIFLENNNSSYPFTTTLATTTRSFENKGKGKEKEDVEEEISEDIETQRYITNVHNRNIRQERLIASFNEEPGDKLIQNVGSFLESIPQRITRRWSEIGQKKSE